MGTTFEISKNYRGFLKGDIVEEVREAFPRFTSSGEEVRVRHIVTQNDEYVPRHLLIRQSFSSSRLDSSPLSATSMAIGATAANTLKCTHCYRKSDSEADLRAHIESCILNPNRLLPSTTQLKCPNCSAFFYTTAGLEGHLKHFHAPLGSLTASSPSIHRLSDAQCPICQKMFTSEYSVMMHVESAHGEGSVEDGGIGGGGGAGGSRAGAGAGGSGGGGAAATGGTGRGSILDDSYSIGGSGSGSGPLPMDTSDTDPLLPLSRLNAGAATGGVGGGTSHLAGLAAATTSRPPTVSGTSQSLLSRTGILNERHYVATIDLLDVGVSELSFHAGEVLIASSHEMATDGWVWARRQGVGSGYIPLGLVKEVPSESLLVCSVCGNFHSSSILLSNHLVDVHRLAPLAVAAATPSPDDALFDVDDNDTVPERDSGGGVGKAPRTLGASERESMLQRTHEGDGGGKTLVSSSSSVGVAGSGGKSGMDKRAFFESDDDNNSNDDYDDDNNDSPTALNVAKFPKGPLGEALKNMAMMEDDMNAEDKDPLDPSLHTTATHGPSLFSVVGRTQSVHEVLNRLTLFPTVRATQPPTHVPHRLSDLCGLWRGLQGKCASSYIDTVLFGVFSLGSAFDDVLCQRPDPRTVAVGHEPYLALVSALQKHLRQVVVSQLRTRMFVPQWSIVEVRLLLHEVWEPNNDARSIALKAASKAACDEQKPLDFLLHLQNLIGTPRRLNYSYIGSGGEEGVSTMTADHILLSKEPHLSSLQKMINAWVALDRVAFLEPPSVLVVGWEGGASQQAGGRGGDGPSNTVPDPYLDLCEADGGVMRLHTMIVKHDNRYVAYVRCSVGQQDTWLYFDSMSDFMTSEGFVPSIQERPNLEAELLECVSNAHLLEAANTTTTSVDLERIVTGLSLCVYQKDS